MVHGVKFANELDFLFRRNIFCFIVDFTMPPIMLTLFSLLPVPSLSLPEKAI